MAASESQLLLPTDSDAAAYEESDDSAAKAALSTYTRLQKDRYAWTDSFQMSAPRGAPILKEGSRLIKHPVYGPVHPELRRLSARFIQSLADSGSQEAQCVPRILSRLLPLVALDCEPYQLRKTIGEVGSVEQLCEEMVDVLIEAVEDGDLMVAAPDHHLPFFSWALTFLLLPRQNEIMTKEEMESQASWFTLLDCLWPDDGSCPHTKWALDFHRRLLLFECGHHAQALDGFAVLDGNRNSVWQGFEKCWLLRVLAEKYSSSERGDQAVDWIRQAEKAAGDPELKSHKHWPYIHLTLLSLQAQYLSMIGMGSTELRAGSEAKYLSAASKVDLQLQFDHSWLDVMKVELLEDQAKYMTRTTFESRLRGLTAIPELSSDQLVSIKDMLGIEEGEYWHLRGLQLLLLGQVKDAKMAFSSMLHLVPEAMRPGAIMEDLHSLLRTPLERPFCTGRVKALARLKLLAWARSREASSAGVVGALENHRAAGLVGALENHHAAGLVGALENYFTLIEKSSVEDQGTGAALWQSWHNAVGTLQSFLDIARIPITDGSVDGFNLERNTGCVGFLCLYASQMFLAMGDAWPPPPRLGIAHTSSKQAFLDDCSRRVLVYAERLRPYSVLWQLHSTGIRKKQHAYAWSKDMHMDRDWEMVTEARINCGSDTVFLHYLGYHGSTVSILHPDGAVSCLRLPFSGQLEGVAKAIISAMDTYARLVANWRGEDLEEFTKAVGEGLEKMYDHVIRPVFEHLGLLMQGQPMNPHRKLVIVSTGDFANVPFSILRNKETGKYLFQEVTLSVTPSFRLLHQCQKRYEELQKRPLFGPGPGAAVAIGDPAYKGRTPDLPGSGKEVKDICDLFNATGNRHQVRMLLKEEATVHAFLDWTVERTGVDGPGRPRYSQAFIHIAAHGRVDQQAPRGALQLANAGHAPDRPSTSQQGPLPFPWPATLLPEGTIASLRAIAEEEASLASRANCSFQDLDSRSGLLPSHWILDSGKEWSAYMLVLSCCNSGAGQQVRYHGTLNLGRAFMFQGIPCCIISLWPIDDTTTAKLMLLFYNAMREGQDVSSALRSAMLTMLDRGYPLRDVAAFVVSGVPTVRLPPDMRAHVVDSHPINLAPPLNLDQCSLQVQSDTIDEAPQETVASLSQLVAEIDEAALEIGQFNSLTEEEKLEFLEICRLQGRPYDAENRLADLIHRRPRHT